MADEPIRTQPNSPTVTRLGSTAVLTGDIEAHEDMLIEGRVQGKITVPSGTLTIAKGAKVEAEIADRGGEEAKQIKEKSYSNMPSACIMKWSDSERSLAIWNVMQSGKARP